MKAFHVSRSAVRSLLALALVTLLAWPAVAAQSQPSLAELARKEAERRKSTKEAKKVITTKDLPESARKPASPPATAAAGPASPPAAGEQKPTTPADGASADQKGEALWRQRITQAREALRRNEVFLEALQTRVNGLSFELANASDFNVRAKVSEDRQKGLAEIERVRADLELSKKQIADIEEEARKAGVPPGWLR